MEWVVYPALFFGGLVSGILSGISGGGGGMLMVPLMIGLGLTPQQAVATGKLTGLGAALGGLSAFWKSGQVRMDILKVMIPIAIVVGLVTPLVFITIDSGLMRDIIGVLLIVMMPTLFIRKQNLKPRTRKQKELGYSVYTFVITLQSVFGSGVGSLTLFVLTLLLGTTKLQANATKRAVTAVLTPLTFAGLFAAGFVRLDYGLAAVGGSFIGTNIGSRIALSRGEGLVTWSMAIVVTLIGVMLLLS